jgi:large conductance mechanosensitive channel
LRVEKFEEKMLEELRRIRESLEKQPTPAIPPPGRLWDEFVRFLRKYGIIGLALAFIIGGAVVTLVSAFVNDILMPIITFFLPQGAWEDYIWRIGPIHISIGHFVSTVIDFMVIALIVFILMKGLEKAPLK